MKGETGAKKYIILFAILFLPTILYLFFVKGEHNFAHLPFITYTNVDGETVQRSAPKFSFIDQEGDTITNKDVEGKIYLVDFFFTSCPTICPIMTANLMKINDRFAHYDEFLILSHTVDPKHDTPAILKQYADDRKINSQDWHFLTGEKDSLYAVAYDYLSSAMEDSLAKGGFLHTEYFILVDKEGHLRSREDDNGNIIGVYDGTDAHQMRDLIDDIKVLIAEYNLELKKNKKPEAAE
ncbi:MAG: SCO family protein [Flavobacteriales bacterium]|nr:SCO family protein [Flavobacteriales bacterium]